MRRLLAAGSALAVISLVFVLLLDDRPTVTAFGPPRDQDHRRAGPVSAPPPFETAGRAPVEVTGVERPPPQADSSEMRVEGAATHGEVHGYVYGQDGEPLRMHGVTLTESDSGAWPLWAQTNEKGFYRFERAAAGNWVVAHTGHVAFRREAASVPDVDPASLEPNDLVTDTGNSLVTVGRVTVLAAQATRFDIRLSGTRVLEGTFRFLDDEFPEGGLSLIIEMRPQLDPDVITASASSAYMPEDPRTGYVRFTGLIPDVYLLRVNVDTVDPTERPYVEWPVDLFDGDVDVGVRDFTIFQAPSGRLFFGELTDDD